MVGPCDKSMVPEGPATYGKVTHRGEKARAKKKGRKRKNNLHSKSNCCRENWSQTARPIKLEKKKTAHFQKRGGRDPVEQKKTPSYRKRA